MDRPKALIAYVKIVVLMKILRHPRDITHRPQLTTSTEPANLGHKL